jgi:hypothetical protein
MSSDEGGVGTDSSSVFRARSSRVALGIFGDRLAPDLAEAFALGDERPAALALVDERGRRLFLMGRLPEGRLTVRLRAEELDVFRF